MTLTLKNKNNIDWIRHQLVTDHLIEMTTEEIWFAIYNDAGRDIGWANKMVESIASDTEALNAFAVSLTRGNGVVFIEPRTGWIAPAELVVLLAAVAMIGWAIGRVF